VQHLEENYFLLNYNTEKGTTKQVRVNHANKEFTGDPLRSAINGILEASVFDRAKTGRLESVKSVYLVTVETTTLF
jgi:hypothetical protein